MIESKDAIIVFTRYPERGKVKTRLAKSIGDEAAFQIQKILAKRTFKECLILNDKKFSLFVFYPEENNEAQVKNLVNGRFSFFTQDGNNLGKKMSNAFRKVFELGFEKAIIIGTDIPDMSKLILSNAFMELEKDDIVIGPSNDGGYYLLGMNKFIPGLFEDIEWSTNSVFEKTINKINHSNFNYSALEELIDLDLKEDLLKWYEVNKYKHDDELVRFIKELNL